jgi:hypothetical protein
MRPQARYQAQAEDRVLQRPTTLRNEEPEEDVSKVDRGKAFLSCYPLHQPSDLQGELNRKIHEPVRDANQSDSGNDVSYNGLADLGVVVVRYHSQDQPHARQKGDCP